MGGHGKVFHGYCRDLALPYVALVQEFSSLDTRLCLIFKV